VTVIARGIEGVSTEDNASGAERQAQAVPAAAVEQRVVTSLAAERGGGGAAAEAEQRTGDGGVLTVKGICVGWSGTKLASGGRRHSRRPQSTPVTKIHAEA
jgi:hypothetical protein